MGYLIRAKLSNEYILTRKVIACSQITAICGCNTIPETYLCSKMPDFPGKLPQNWFGKNLSDVRHVIVPYNFGKKLPKSSTRDTQSLNL